MNNLQNNKYSVVTPNQFVQSQQESTKQYPNRQNYQINNNLTNDTIQSPNLVQANMTSNFFSNDPNSNDGWSDFNDWNDNDSHKYEQKNIQQTLVPAVQQQTFQSSIPNVQQIQPNVQLQFTEAPVQIPEAPYNQETQNLNYLPPSHQPSMFMQPHLNNYNDYNSGVSNSNDTWNWNSGEQQKPINTEQFSKVSQDSILKHTRNIDLNASEPDQSVSLLYNQNQNFSNDTENLQTRIPDDSKNTQNITNPVLQRVRKTEPLLTPQWSIESQMSHTSSDRSIESDNLDSTATTSEELNNIRTNQNVESCYENNQYHANYLQQTADTHIDERKDILTNIGEMDSLDQALLEINEPKTQISFYEDTSIPNLSHSIENQIMPQSVEKKNVDTKLLNSEIRKLIPPPQVAPPPPPQISGSSSNLYRRTTLPMHRNLQFQAPNVATPALMPTNLYPDNHETITPDNSELPEMIPNKIEAGNQEIAPTNERNQYLQTGHLSEESTISSSPAPAVVENIDFLPPPGLSRLVLGQPENENFQNNYNEPPLDRMVPGTELANSSNLSFERHADGEVSTSNTLAIRGSSYPVPSSSSIETAPAQLNISDRNLYFVPGESNNSQSQRVVPGGDEENFTSEMIDLNLTVNEEERELVMDGENLEDEPQIQNQLSEITTREEPIEGANTLDEISANIGNANLAETEPNNTLDIRKDISNTSTANDDSDKERNSYYKTRRGEEIQRKRNNNKSKERYETEDTDYYSDKDRRRYERDVNSRDRGDVRNDRDKERDRYRDRRDNTSHDRDRYRRDDVENDRYYKEKYERDRGERYDRNNSRYETDGSKYDNDRDGNRHSSRNDYQKRKDGRDTRDDRDSDFRRDDKDRKYRRDRSEKERDDRRRGK